LNRTVAAVSRRLSPQNEPAGRPGQAHTQGKRDEHAWHIFSAWDRKSDQEE